MSTKQNISNKILNDNHEFYLQRVALFKKFGLNNEKERKIFAGHVGNKNQSILEIGTGKGYLTVLLGENCSDIVSVDVDPEQQAFAKLNAEYACVINNINFIIADEFPLPNEDKSFDAVVSAFTFHHLKEPFLVVSEMIRMCKNKIVISDFNERGFSAVESVHREEGRKHKRESGDFRIVGTYLKEYGFRVTEARTEFQKIYIATRR